MTDLKLRRIIRDLLRGYMPPNSHQGAYDQSALLDVNLNNQFPVQLLVNGAVPLSPSAIMGASGPILPQLFVITKAGVLTDTIAAPSPATASGLGSPDDGKIISFLSLTAFAHVFTTIPAGNFRNGSSSVTTATFAAFAGAYLRLVAFQGIWYVEAQNNVTLT